MAHYNKVSIHDTHEMTSGSSLFPDHQANASPWIDRSDPSVYPYNSPTPVSYSSSASITRHDPKVPASRRKKIVYVSLLALLLIAAAIAIPVALTANKKKSGSSAANGGSSSSDSPTSGKSGSIITLEDGTKFTYTNNFGGDWASDPKSPFAAGGTAQSWSKRIGTEDWNWGTDTARGVNLGGWLVTEPFICPALYEKYINNSNVPVVDEWSLSIAMGENLAKEMEAHYSTFITEKDFAEIVAAGLNWVRIPIGFWAIETINDEPFLVGTSWKYFLKAVQWGRKYGVRIYLDLHALPGSQNGWNHSGKSGSVNFMHGVMGIANAQRTLTYLRIITQFVSQDQYRDVVGIVGIVNEILWATVGEIPVQSFYFAAYEAIRNSTGTGSGAGPYIAIHEGFQGPGIWEGFLAGADRLALDQHPYLAFTGDRSPPETMANKPCAWAIATNQSQKAFGVTVGGEFSSAINDCGLWLNGIGGNPGYPDCSPWDDWSSYNATTIATLKQVTLASMDALQNFFFWTWKIGNSTVLKTSSSPLWHYRLGLQRGWVPQDPREAIGHCAGVLGSAQVFDGSYAPSATGGAGAPGTVNPAQASSHTFPPPTISPTFSAAQITLLPTYTATGKIKTLFAPTFTAAPSAAVGDGWSNNADNALAFVPVAGCQYPDPWNAVNASLPATPCTGS